MTDEQRERLLDRLLENQAIHDAHFRKLEENQAIHEAHFRKLEENQAIHEAHFRKLEENQAIHEAHFRKMEELQMADHIAISRINNLMADFAEKHHAALLEIDNRLIRLESLVEAFIRGARHNGGSRAES